MASRKEYETMFKIGAQMQSSFASAFGGAATEVTKLQRQITQLNRTQGRINAFTKQAEAVKKTERSLKTYREQLTNITKALKDVDSPSAAMQNRQLSKQLQIDNTNARLNQQKDKLNELGEALKRAGIDTSKLGEEGERLEEELKQLTSTQLEVAESSQNMGVGIRESAAAVVELAAALGVIVALKKLYEAFVEVTEAAIEFESAMTGVSKTTDLSDLELKTMGDELQAMSRIIPIVTNELAGITETAGQLGVRKENLVEFTRVMAMLASSTDMTAQEGATMLAQFAAITQMDPRYYENLASSVVELGNNYATTERRILDMSQGMAAAADIAGMAEADTLGLAAAISSVGVESQLGATAATKMIMALDKAVKTGDKLQEYSRIAGLSAYEFQKAWGEDAAETLVKFIEGLNDTERNGMGAIQVLEELGISEIRLQRVMLSLANSGDLLRGAIADSNKAWEDNTALQDEATKRYETTESKLQLARNAFEELKVTIGELFLPVVAELAEIAAKVLQTITDWIEKNPELARTLLTLAAGIGVGGAVYIAFSAFIGIVDKAKKALELFGFALPTGWKGLLAAGAIMAVAAGFAYLVNRIAEGNNELEKLQTKGAEMIEEYNKNKEVLDLIKEYKDLRKELKEDTLEHPGLIEEYQAIWQAYKDGTITAIEHNRQLDALQEKYIALVDESGKLKEMERQIIDASGGFITAKEGETEALQAQIDAYESLVELKEYEQKLGIQNNLTEQAKHLPNILENINKYTTEVTDSQKELERLNKETDGLVDNYNKLMNIKDNLPTDLSQLPRTMEQASKLWQSIMGEDPSWGASPIAMFERLTELQDDVNSGTFILSNTRENLYKTEQEGLDKSLAALEKYKGEYLEFIRQMRESGWTDEEIELVLKPHLDDDMLKAVMSDITSGSAELQGAVADAQAVIDGAAQELSASDQEQLALLQVAVDEAKVKMDELAQAYEKAYNAAYSSISGQLKLFTELDKPKAKDLMNTKEMVTSLDEQAKFVEDYADNISKARELGVNTELISQLADGTVESAMYLEQIVNSSDETIEELNASFARVQEGKETFANEVADMQTNFTQAMQQIEQELTTTIQNMNMSAEAYSSGMATIQGFISGAQSMQGAVVAAFSAIGAAASAALSSALKIKSPSRVMYEKGVFTVLGLVNSVKDNGGMFADAITDMAKAGVEAYNKIDYASLLGPNAYTDNGRVYIRTEPVTAQMSERAGNNITVAPTYNISGANAGEVRSVLYEHNESLRELVLNIVAEEDSDLQRRRYNG